MLLFNSSFTYIDDSFVVVYYVVFSEDNGNASCRVEEREMFGLFNRVQVESRWWCSLDVSRIYRVLKLESCLVMELDHLRCSLR
jgi:hypothetical protein